MNPIVMASGATDAASNANTGWEEEDGIFVSSRWILARYYPAILHRNRNRYTIGYILQLSILL